MRLTRVLIANRGEIAIRLIKSCQKLDITAVAVYASEDATSLHVRMADEAYELDLPGSRGYLDISCLLRLCQLHNIHAVMPGYGFLSEDANLARQLSTEGILFVGPTPQSIEEFGLKHEARRLAIEAGVPVVPGSTILSTYEEAEAVAQSIGFPLMVKATAGGGGMGLQRCFTPEQLQEAVSAVQSRGAALSNNAGFFLERYIERSRHIETQIFGNGLGDVLFLGERECSVQRRHQKIIEESPSPFILKHPHIRQRLAQASTLLAESVQYKSAGTVEFLVDDDTGDFHFLEMNTRLQVEHGITELCYSVDLVEMMLLQAEAELQGLGGLDKASLQEFSRDVPVGHAIEIRAYAENPAKDFAPAPGLFQRVCFPTDHGVRVDTWIETGTYVSPAFDPLLAKIMVHADDRGAATDLMVQTLAKTVLQGPPTNLHFLTEVLQSADFTSGNTTTSMLAQVSYAPPAIDFLDGGAYTTVQDWPGRLTVPNGVPTSGPMDSLSFRIANMLVGNAPGVEGLEITLSGPRIRFYREAVIAVCGPNSFPFTINGLAVALWTRHNVPAGAEVSIGHATEGARAYLAVRGGFPGVASYLGSKSTTPGLGWGGYQGRCIKSGDFLMLDASSFECPSASDEISLPLEHQPPFTRIPRLFCLPGPYFSEDYIVPGATGQDRLVNSQWTVSHDSSRNGIRLTGDTPTWTRTDGGDGGSHPSNVVGYGTTNGAVSWTGDTPIILPVDGQNQTGFLVSHTIITCDLWRLGQLRPSDTIEFELITWTQALKLENRLDAYLNGIQTWIQRKLRNESCHDNLVSLDWTLPRECAGDGVLLQRNDANCEPSLCIRQAGERGLFGLFGDGTFDVKRRARIQRIANCVLQDQPVGFSPHCVTGDSSILFTFDPHKISQSKALEMILQVEAKASSIEESWIPNRTIHLPAVFDAAECIEATKKYMLLQRPTAAYLPDNIDFIRRSNGLASRDAVKACFFGTPHLVTTLGTFMGLPTFHAVDPRCSLIVPKCNPVRTWTPAGALGAGGKSSAIYPNDGPGGFMLWGITLPHCCWDMYGRKKGFTEDKPWLFELFDTIVFDEVDRETYDRIVKKWNMGIYEIQIEQSKFDLDAYAKMLEDALDEVIAKEKIQKKCTAAELESEKALFQQWIQEKEAIEAAAIPQDDGIENLLREPDIFPVTANMIAGVWKVLVTKGSIIAADEVIVILEAMKMEISVRAPSSTIAETYRVEATIAQTGQKVVAGDRLVLLRALP